MSKVEIIREHFRTREDAIAEIASDGLWPISWVDKPGAEYSPHCHRDRETIYVVEGSLEFTDVGSRETHVLRAGDKLLLPARLTHSARSDEGAVYIMGIRTLVALEDHVLPPEEGVA